MSENMFTNTNSQRAIDVSICIVSYNTRQLLANCIESVQRNTRKVSYEIIVVDNNSTDGTQELLAKGFPEVRRIYNTNNDGFARAANQAVKLSSGDYILLLNPDTLVLEDAIDKCFQFIKGRPENILVTCNILNQDGCLQRIGKGTNFFSLKAQFFMGFYLDHLFRNSPIVEEALLKHFDHDRLQKVAYIPGCFVLVKRRFLHEIGLLDEDYFLYSEDADLCHRVREVGGEIYYFPDAAIVHFGGRSVEQISLSAHLEFNINRFKLYKKNFGHGKALTYRVIVAGGALLRIVRMTWRILAKRERRASDYLKKNIWTVLWALGLMDSGSSIRQEKHC